MQSKNMYFHNRYDSAFNFKSCHFFATFVRWSLSYTLEHRWCSHQAITSIKVQNIHFHFQSVCWTFFFFHFMFFRLSWGKTHTWCSISTMPRAISYGKNWGRLGEGSADEKIYALMSNSFSKKEMLTLQVCFLCREYLTVPRLSSGVQS